MTPTLCDLAGAALIVVAIIGLANIVANWAARN
jgi:hypothetical protein